MMIGEGMDLVLRLDVVGDEAIWDGPGGTGVFSLGAVCWRC